MKTTKSEAWQKGFKKAQEMYKDKPVQARNLDAIYFLLLVLAKNCAETDEDHERIGFIQGTFL